MQEYGTQANDVASHAKRRVEPSNWKTTLADDGGLVFERKTVDEFLSMQEQMLLEMMAGAGDGS